MEKIDYAEILFEGKCNYSCYYCLSEEMVKMKQKKNNQLLTHFTEWNNFDKFMKIVKDNNISTIYLSSTITEPTLYKYFDELTTYLQNNEINVGIRSNGSLLTDKNFNTLEKMTGEVSLSLQSINQATHELITRNRKKINWGKILNELKTRNIKNRITIVVNKYNIDEIPEILDFLSNYSAIIEYVQLRKIYKYNNEKLENEDNKAFDIIKDWVINNCDLVGNFHEAINYNYKNSANGNNLKISLWEDVFKKESLNTLNYFSSGLITGDNLLVRAYETTTSN